MDPPTPQNLAFWHTHLGFCRSSDQHFGFIDRIECANRGQLAGTWHTQMSASHNRYEMQTPVRQNSAGRAAV